MFFNYLFNDLSIIPLSENNSHRSFFIGYPIIENMLRNNSLFCDWGGLPGEGDPARATRGPAASPGAGAGSRHGAPGPGRREDGGSGRGGLVTAPGLGRVGLRVRCAG